MVETGWGATQMPLSDDGRLVTRALKQLGEGLLATIKLRPALVV